MRCVGVNRYVEMVESKRIEYFGAHMMNYDFSFDKYRELCSGIAGSGYKAITVRDYFSGTYPDKFIILRHDIDRKPKNALKTATIEHKLGIDATYYFRANSNVFIPQIMQEIEDMGHEVGYHYETLSESKGDYATAIELFKSELDKFRNICDIKTICMHGRPLSKHDNRDLWNIYDFRDFGIIGEAYLSAGEDINYFSDTGRSWNSKNSIRDFMPNTEKGIVVHTTDDLIGLVKSDKIDNLYTLSHPERWSTNGIEWIFNYITDFVFNSGKKVLMVIR